MRFQLLPYVRAAALLAFVPVPLLGAPQTEPLREKAAGAPCRPVLKSEAVICEARSVKHITEWQPLAGDADSREFVVDHRGNTAGVWGLCSDRSHLELRPPGINVCSEAVAPSRLGSASAQAAFWKTPKTVVDLGTYRGDSDSVLLERNDKGEIVRE